MSSIRGTRAASRPPTRVSRVTRATSAAADRRHGGGPREAARRFRVRAGRGRRSLSSMEETDSRVEVYVTTDTSEAPHKADEPRLWVMYDAAKPEAGKLYFTEAEWDAFVLGVKDGEFDLDEDGNLPPVPADQLAQQAQQARQAQQTQEP